MRPRHWKPSGPTSPSSPRTCRSSEQDAPPRSEEHTSELQSHSDLVCRLLLEKKKISLEDPQRLQRITELGSRLVVLLKMETHFDTDVASASMIGEISGREKQDEVVGVSAQLY